MPVKNVSGYLALTSEYSPSADRKSCLSDLTGTRQALEAHRDAAGATDARTGDHHRPLALRYRRGNVQERPPLREELMFRRREYSIKRKRDDAHAGQRGIPVDKTGGREETGKGCPSASSCRSSEPGGYDPAGEGLLIS